MEAKEKRMNRIGVFLLALLAWTTPAQADLVEKTVEYKQGNTVLEGYLVYDEALKKPAPIGGWLFTAGPFIVFPNLPPGMTRPAATPTTPAPTAGRGKKCGLSLTRFLVGKATDLPNRKRPFFDS